MPNTHKWAVLPIRQPYFHGKWIVIYLAWLKPVLRIYGFKRDQGSFYVISWHWTCDCKVARSSPHYVFGSLTYIVAASTILYINVIICMFHIACIILCFTFMYVQCFRAIQIEHYYRITITLHYITLYLAHARSTLPLHAGSRWFKNTDRIALSIKTIDHN